MKRWLIIGPMLVAGVLAAVWWAGAQGGRWQLPGGEGPRTHTFVDRQGTLPSPMQILTQKTFDIYRHEVPQKVLDALRIEPGTVVADVGAGSGVYTREFGRMAGASGRVIATELSPLFLAYAAHRYAVLGCESTPMAPLSLIWSRVNDCLIGEGQVDLLFLAHLDRFMEADAPADEIFAESVATAVKAGGRVAVLQWLFRMDGHRRVPGVETIATIEGYFNAHGLVLEETHWPRPDSLELPRGPVVLSYSPDEWYDTALLIFRKGSRPVNPSAR